MISLIKRIRKYRITSIQQLQAFLFWSMLFVVLMAMCMIMNS